MTNGFLVVDKPAGVTSHDVVSRVRRAFCQKKAGHTGTLDPFATGVLPIALGEATKAIPFLDESIKEYQAVMRLGAVTDTLDCTGTVLRCSEWHHVSQESVQMLQSRFTGELRQVPPMYSALKRDGIPLYKLARKGETVERAARTIVIESLVIDRVSLPDIAFTVRCSKGTYVRTLADDMGAALGTGAYLTYLRRTASGLFRIEDAVPFEDVAAGGACGDAVISVCRALAGLPEFHLNSCGYERVRRGISPAAEDFETVAENGGGTGPIKLLFRGELAAVAEAVGAEIPRMRIVRGFNLLCSLHGSQ